VKEYVPATVRWERPGTCYLVILASFHGPQLVRTVTRLRHLSLGEGSHSLTNPKMSNKAQAAVELIPARWWEVIAYIRMNVAIMRGHDPWMDQVLARPWSLHSLVEYAYMVVGFFLSRAQWIYVSGERAGVLWAREKRQVQYIVSLGLLPQFQARGTGVRAASLLMEYSNQRGFDLTAARIAVRNKDIQAVVNAFGAIVPGLAMTQLKLAPLGPPEALEDQPSLQIQLKLMSRGKAAQNWRRWKLQGVRHLASEKPAAAVGTLLDAWGWLDALPRGDCYAVSTKEREVGVAIASLHGDACEITLACDPAWWVAAKTVDLVRSLATEVGKELRFLAVTRQHADILEIGSLFDFERDRESERHLVLWMYPYRFLRRKRGSRNSSGDES
jgi:ribosomal protein S18 acetylase RimI-like enzyme